MVCPFSPYDTICAWIQSVQILKAWQHETRQHYCERRKYHPAMNTAVSPLTEEGFNTSGAPRRKPLSLGTRLLSNVGALLLSVLVVWPVFTFWHSLSNTWQAIIVLVATLGSFVGTFRLYRDDRTRHLTLLAALISLGCFVLNTLMLEPRINVADPQFMVLAWAAMALLLAYGCQLRTLLFIGLFCVVAIFYPIAEWLEISPQWLVSKWPEIFTAAAVLILLVPQVISHSSFPQLAKAYRMAALWVAFLPILFLCLQSILFDPYLAGMPWPKIGELILVMCTAIIAILAAVWLRWPWGWREPVVTGNGVFIATELCSLRFAHFNLTYLVVMLHGMFVFLKWAIDREKGGPHMAEWWDATTRDSETMSDRLYHFKHSGNRKSRFIYPGVFRQIWFPELLESKNRLALSANSCVEAAPEHGSSMRIVTAMEDPLRLDESIFQFGTRVIDKTEEGDENRLAIQLSSSQLSDQERQLLRDVVDMTKPHDDSDYPYTRFDRFRGKLYRDCEAGKRPWRHYEAICETYREIYGNPFRKAPNRAAWLHYWRTPEVLRLADKIYEQDAFERMPELGDALAMADCEDLAILAHCRSNKTHHRGCWVLDLILEKDIEPQDKYQQQKDRAKRFYVFKRAQWAVWLLIATTSALLLNTAIYN